MKNKKIILILSCAMVFSLTACNNKTVKEPEKVITEETLETQEDNKIFKEEETAKTQEEVDITKEESTENKKTTVVEDANTDDFDNLIKDNKSIVITEDNMGTIIIIEELYYINVFMGDDEEDICIRCSENDFRKIKEDINNGEITLVYKPIDQNKYLMMYENEQILLSYK